MCHLAVDTTFGSRFGVKVCDEEMKEPRNIPTIILMRRLKAKNPNCMMTSPYHPVMTRGMPPDDLSLPPRAGTWHAT